MECRFLGRTGLRVSALGLGAGLFGYMGKVSEDDGIRITHAALDGGINLIDTSDLYSYGESETIIGKALKGRRDKVVLMSKFGYPISGDPNESGGSRRWVMEAAERSLRRLGTDYLDVFQLHTPDFFTPIEETIGAFNDLIGAGKIRHYGMSNCSAALIQSAVLRAEMKGLDAPHTEQSGYSIFHRGVEAEILPACEEHGIAFMAYSPLDGGWLSGKHRKNQPKHKSARQDLVPWHWDLSNPANERKQDLVEQLVELSQEAGLDLKELAIGFVLANRSVACALFGAGKVEHVEDLIGTPGFTLSDEVLDAIDTIVPPASVVPNRLARSANPAMRR